MNRKPIRKLALAKETLRHLESETLRQARGEAAQVRGDESVGDTCRTRGWSSCPPCD